MNNEWFFEKFALISDAPGAVARMRQLILTLAIQGKLIPQAPNDESADVLLAKLRIDEPGDNGRRRKADQLSKLTPDEIPFDLPSGWAWERLGSIGETNIGLTYSPQDLSDVGIPVLRSSNIQNGKLDYADLVRVKCEPKSSVMVKEGDLLICARNGSRALVGKAALIENLTEPAAFGAFMAIFRSPINRYLYHFICSPLFRRMIDEVNTTTINQITQSNLRTTLAPIPPLAEQKRIVAKVDELMGLCDVLEAQQQERELQKSVLVRSSLSRFAESPTRENLGYLFHNSYDIPPSELRKSILTLAVQGKLVPQDPEDEPADVLLQRLRSEKLENIRTGKMRKLRSNEDSFVPDPDVPLPPGWALGCIADFGAPEDNAVVDGPFGSNLKLSDYDQNGAYPVITISNIDDGFDLATLRKVTEKKFQELKRSAVRANDILVAKIGSSYGKVGRYPDYMPVGIIPANLLKITPHPSMDWRFLIKALQSPDFKAELEQIVQFTAQPAFGVSRFKLLPIAVPPLAEQHRIVAKVDQLMALVDELERQQAASREKASNLLDAMVHEMTSSG